MLRILHRYVLVDLLLTLVVSFVAITTIMVLVGVVSEATRRGLGPVQIMRIAPFLVPGMMPYTLPVCTLFAVNVVFGRMASDNEITAIKASGQSVMTVIWPAIITGLVLSGIMAALFHRFIPWSQERIQSVAYHDIEDVFYSVLAHDHVLDDKRFDYVINVTEVEGHTLIHPIFLHRESPKPGALDRDLNRFDRTIEAEWATLRFDLPQQLIHVHLHNAQISTADGQQQGSFVDHEVPVSMGRNANDDHVKSSQEMTMKELLEQRDVAAVEYAKIRQRLPVSMFFALARGELEQTNDQGKARGFPWHELAAFRTDQQAVRSRYFDCSTQYCMRWALSCSALFFVLIGAPVGILQQRRDYLSAFISCFLPIIVMYYPLTLFGMNLGRDGLIHPALAMCMGNAALLLLGILVFRPVLRH